MKKIKTFPFLLASEYLDSQNIQNLCSSLNVPSDRDFQLQRIFSNFSLSNIEKRLLLHSTQLPKYLYARLFDTSILSKQIQTCYAIPRDVREKLCNLKDRHEHFQNYYEHVLSQEIIQFTPHEHLLSICPLHINGFHIDQNLNIYDSKLSIFVGSCNENIIYLSKLAQSHIERFCSSLYPYYINTLYIEKFGEHKS